MYNFRKVVQDPNSGEFKHDLFRQVRGAFARVFGWGLETGFVSTSTKGALFWGSLRSLVAGGG